MPDWITFGSIFQVLKWTLIVVVALWFVRTALLWILRFVGLYNPNLYWLLPRVPWRTLARPVRFIESWIADFAMGTGQTAKWAGPIGTLCMMYRPGAVLLGRVRMFNIPWFMPVGLMTKRHLVMVAGTGAGKTTSLIAMLALHRGNAFVIDPKGQITRVLHRRMGAGGAGIIGKGKRALALDPLGIVAGVKSACWNPFDEMAAIEASDGSAALPEIADKMATALVQQDSETQPFFANASREFVKALILHVYTTAPAGQRNLVYLRRLLTRGIEEAKPGTEEMTGIERLVMEMCQNNAFEVIANAAGTIRDAIKKDNSGSLLSSAMVQLGWLDYDNIAAISQRSDFSLAELKTGDLNLFVCAKTTDVQSTYTGWFRLLTVMATEAFERIQSRPKHSTLFAIDEMPSLGRIEAFETAAPVLRSYGVQLLAITQDLGLLGRAYPQTWASFLGNADAVIWMASNHNESLRYLEAELGAWTDETGRDRPIAYANQIKRYLEAQRGRLIVTVNGKRALRLSTPHYFKELPVTHYDRDPNENEKPQRALTRAIASKILGPAKEEVEAPVSRPAAAPERIRTPRGTFTNHQDGTVSHAESGLVFIGYPWGAQYENGRFTGEWDTFTWDHATMRFGRGEPISINGAHLSDADAEAGAFRCGYKPGKSGDSFGGHSDWRLPTADEMTLLRLPADALGKIMPDFARNNRVFGPFWTANGAESEDTAWCAEADTLEIGSDPRERPCGVLLVRHDPIKARVSATTFNNTRGVFALEYLSDGARFVTSELGDDNTPRLGVYDAKTLGLISFVPLSDETERTYAIGVVPGQDQVWIGMKDRLRCIDLVTGKDVTKPIKASVSRAASIHVLPDGTLLTHDGSGTPTRAMTRLARWDTAKRKMIGHTFTPYAKGTIEGVGSDQIGLLDASRNRFFTGQHTGYVRQWDTQTLELVRDIHVTTPAGHGDDDAMHTRANMIHALALSEDGNRLAVGTQAGVIHVVDLSDRDEASRFTLIPSDFDYAASTFHDGVPRPVAALMFLNDTTLLAGYEAGGLRTWDISARKQVGDSVVWPYSDDGHTPTPRRFVALHGADHIVAFDPWWYGAPASPWLYDASNVAAASYKSRTS